MASTGDRGPFGGVCVDVIHTDDYGDINIFSQEEFAYIPPFMKTAYTPLEWERKNCSDEMQGDETYV